MSDVLWTRAHDQAIWSALILKPAQSLPFYNTNLEAIVQACEVGRVPLIISRTLGVSGKDTWRVSVPAMGEDYPIVKHSLAEAIAWAAFKWATVQEKRKGR